MINLIGYTINEMGLTSQLLAEYTGKNFMSDLGNLVVVIVSVAGALMTLYAIYIAYLFATASDPTKRKAARERLVKTVASTLIIIGLASVIAVINVHFNKAEGRIDNISGGGGTNYTSAYSYDSFTTFMFSEGTAQDGCFVAQGSFSLSAANIKMNGVAFGEAGQTIRFQKCRVVSPQWNVLNSNFDIDNPGTATYTCSLKSDNNPYAITISGNQNGDSYTVTVAVTFVMESNPDKELSVNIDVILDSTTSKISFRQG